MSEHNAAGARPDDQIARLQFDAIMREINCKHDFNSPEVLFCRGCFEEALDRLHADLLETITALSQENSELLSQKIAFSLKLGRILGEKYDGATAEEIATKLVAADAHVMALSAEQATLIHERDNATLSEHDTLRRCAELTAEVQRLTDALTILRTALEKFGKHEKQL